MEKKNRIFNVMNKFTSSASVTSKCLNVVVPGRYCVLLRVTICDSSTPFSVPKQSIASVTEISKGDYFNDDSFIKRFQHKILIKPNKFSNVFLPVMTISLVPSVCT